VIFLALVGSWDRTTTRKLDSWMVWINIQSLFSWVNCCWKSWRRTTTGNLNTSQFQCQV